MALTTDQLIERRTYLGGTDMAALAGVSRWATPIDVWQDKLATDTPADRPTDAMTMGNIMEQIVADLFAGATGLHVRRPMTRARLADGTAAAIRDPHRPYLGGRPDRITAGDGVLECKWSASSEGWGDLYGADLAASGQAAVVPPGYAIQVQHYLGITGRRVGYLAVVLGYGKFRWYTLPRDDGLIEDLRLLGERFWLENVEAKVPPLPDGSPSYGRWLSSQRSDTWLSAIATPEQAIMADALQSAQAALLVAQHARDLAQQRLQASMASADRLDLPDGRHITWRTQERRTTAWKAVAAAQRALLLEWPERTDMPDLLAAMEATVTTTTTARPFLVPWPTTMKEDPDAPAQ